MGVLGALWGLGGIAFMLVYAIYRLYPQMLEALSLPLDWYHWLAMIVSVLFMAYSEGYKGFQKGFSPRVAARARYMQSNPRVHQVLLSPFFCAGYFDSTRRRKISIFVLTLGIIVLIILVRQLSQPWRGILDAGVVVGLSWGLLSMFYYGFLALTAPVFDYSAEMPDEA